MPTPNQGEGEQDFVSRCIPVVMNEGTAKDNKQAAAICHSMFQQHSEGQRKAKVAHDQKNRGPE